MVVKASIFNFELFFVSLLPNYLLLWKTLSTDTPIYTRIYKDMWTCIVIMNIIIIKDIYRHLNSSSSHHHLAHYNIEVFNGVHVYVWSWWLWLYLVIWIGAKIQYRGNIISIYLHIMSVCTYKREWKPRIRMGDEGDPFHIRKPCRFSYFIINNNPFILFRTYSSYLNPFFTFEFKTYTTHILTHWLTYIIYFNLLYFLFSSHPHIARTCAVVFVGIYIKPA